jgi:hypothetical protein
MEINEFIDTYSDDLINLHEARTARITHPLRGDYAFSAYLDASFCRILAVFVIGGIEAMLESWRDRDRVNVLEKYFAQNVTNGERVTSLYQAFSGAGIRVDRDVFDDYLAIKYLRNTIIHGRWKEHEKEWLAARGFPTDTRQLTKEHLDKIEHVNQNMMLYIALTSVADPAAPKPEKLVKLDVTITRRTDDTGILRVRDIERIIWNNLERIDAHIYADIEKTAITEQYDWTGGRSQAELDGLGHEARKRFFYLAARRAGEENHEPLAQHRALATEALEFWREYWQRAAAASSLDEACIGQALELLESPEFARAAGGASWCSLLHDVPHETARLVVDSALERGATFTSEQVVNAFRAGHRTYDFIPNIMPVTLFTVRLPIVDPANTPAYLREAGRALRAFRLNRAWYSWAENRCPPAEDGLEFYERMSQEFASRSSAPSA